MSYPISGTTSESSQLTATRESKWELLPANPDGFKIMPRRDLRARRKTRVQAVVVGPE
jgi:hypothetical protein